MNEDIYKDNNGTYFWDFYFEKDGSFIRELGEEGTVNYVVDLMILHAEYHKKIADTNYVPVGSILACTYGSILAKLSADVVTQVCVGNGAPVLTCSDCSTGQNIPTFGACTCPESVRMGMPGRRTGTWGSANGPSGGVYEPQGYKCIPLIEEGWKQPGNNKVLIWVSSSGEYSYALKDNAILVCKYGGIIGVVEVKMGLGQIAITNDWLRLYSSPTVSGTGRAVSKHHLANNYDWGMPEELNIENNAENYSTNSMAATIINASGGTLTVKKESNNVYTDDEGRYWVAVGPKFMNPNHTSNMKIKPEKMYYGTKIDIHVVGQHDGRDYYIPAVVGDAKEHSKPDGLYQTGVPFDPNRPTVTADGSSVEFIGYDIETFINANGDSISTVNYTNEYKLVELIIYDGIFNY